MKAQACPEDASALTPAPLEESRAIEWWTNRHESKLNEDGRESAKVLWFSGSITHGWENSGKYDRSGNQRFIKQLKGNLPVYKLEFQ